MLQNSSITVKALTKSLQWMTTQPGFISQPHDHDIH